MSTFKQKIVNTNIENAGMLREDIVVIENFFPKAYADELYKVLYNLKKWNYQDTANEKELAKFNFGYRRKNLELKADNSPKILHELQDNLNSQLIFDWIHNISKCDVNTFAGTASWLRAGNYLSSHNDAGDPRRRVTFNYYLTKNWKAEWGGSFVYDHSRQVVIPSYNTLVLFKVGDHSWHNVTPVSKFSSRKNKRLAITGWFAQV